MAVTTKARAAVQAAWARCPRVPIALQRTLAFVLFVWALLSVIGVTLSWRRWACVVGVCGAYFVWSCFDAVRTGMVAARTYSARNLGAEAQERLLGPVHPTDTQHNEALLRFERLKRSTECMFARKARLWASADWDYAMSLELNVARNVAALTQFVLSSRARATPELVRFNHTRGLFERVVPPARTRWQRVRREVRRVWAWFAGDGSHVLARPLDDPDRVALGPLHDGFLFEIRGREHCASVPVFGQTVRRLLLTLSLLDPAFNACSIAQRPMLRPPHVMASDSWHFEWMHEPITVTSFAPCYGPHSSRYAFAGLDDPDIPPEQVSSFVLLQPESSFVWHDMGPGLTRAQTRWDRPATMREKIRCKFLAAGREYGVAEYNDGAIPAAQHIVRTHHLNDPPLQWFVPNAHPDADTDAGDEADARADVKVDAAATADGVVSAAAPAPAAAAAAMDTKSDAATATASAVGTAGASAAAAAAAGVGATIGGDDKTPEPSAAAGADGLTRRPAAAAAVAAN